MLITAGFVSAGSASISKGTATKLPSTRTEIGPWSAPDGGFAFVTQEASPSFVRYDGGGALRSSVALGIMPRDVTFGPDDVAYVLGSDPNTGVGSLLRIDLSGHVTQIRDLAAQGAPAGDNLQFASDGNLYVQVVRNFVYYLEQVNPISGTIGSEIALSSLNGLLATRPGLVVFAGPITWFVPLSNPGAVRSEPVPFLGNTDSFAAVSVGPDGTTDVLHFPGGNGITIPPDFSCGAVTLSKISVDGSSSWSHALASLVGYASTDTCKPLDVDGTAGGGSVLTVMHGTQLTMVWLDTNAHVLASASPDFGTGSVTATRTDIDANGIAVIQATVTSMCDPSKPSTTCSEIDIRSFNRGTQLASSSIQGSDNNYVKLFSNGGDTTPLLNGAVAVVANHGVPNSGGDGTSYSIDMVPAPVTREGWRDPTPASGPPPNRYVALGDSVPYGHGLANPYPYNPPGATGVNQGPSLHAYPSLVAAQLGLPMTVRSSGCPPIAGDQLSISGAPVSTGNIPMGEMDSKCLVPPQPAESVENTEFMAAHLDQAPADLVTIQGGGDDVNFADCLTYEVTVKTQLSGPIGAKPCLITPTYSTDSNGLPVVGKSTKPSPAYAAALGNLQRGLASLLIKVAPYAQHIAVLNYYQLFPRPNDFDFASRTGANGIVAATNLVCYGMSTNLKHGYADAVFLQGLLNNAISGAVAEAQAQSTHPLPITLIDISNTFSTHEMCTKNPAVFSGELMSNYLWAIDIAKAAAGSASAKMELKNYVWRAGHPNAFGQTDLANAAITALTPILGP